MIRPLLVPLGLYSLAGLIAGYFVWHGLHGQRGLKTGEEYEQRLAQLRLDRDLLKLERMQWDKRIALFRGETVDADILDEESRALLGRVHKNEVVIFIPNGDGATATR
ncbi:MAG: septum formation initiator family protein [Methylocystis sp.]|jgi:cell division protein FtsB